MPLRDYLSENGPARPWRGSFAEYFERVCEKPEAAELAHARVARMIESAGVEEADGRRGYPFFSEELFGMDDVIEQLVDYFRSAGKRLDIRKRVLLLMGPPASAKSTTVGMIKRGLERFSRTEAGALYGIVGCPMHEEPLHLLDEAARRRLRDDRGIWVEGELCPVCEWRRETEWTDTAAIEVERVFISEGRRVGIGSFTPGDPKVVSLEDLVGSLDLVKVSEYGSEAHPLAWDFRGAMEVASRGLLECVELLKAQAELLYPLLTLAQEQQIKAGRFSLFYSDECIVAHSNEAEFQRFASDRKNEAIQNRTYVVRVPYVLRVEDEVKIYRKLIGDSFVRTHLAPHTLSVAAQWAVLTRLRDHPKYDRVLKMKLYNGEEVAEHSTREVEDLRRESRLAGEGMTGVGPRQVINLLSQAIARSPVPCLNPVDAVRALRDATEHHIGDLGREEAEALLKSATNEYREAAFHDVQRAFIQEFDAAAQTLLLNYLDNAQASLNEEKVRDPVTGEDLPPDEKLMRSIEEAIAVSDSAKREFRRDILMRVGVLARKGQSFRWDSHPRLKDAIEKRLFSDLSGTMKLTITAPTPDPEQRQKIEGVRRRLIEGYDYCEHCADAVLQFVGHMLQR